MDFISSFESTNTHRCCLNEKRIDILLDSAKQRPPFSHKKESRLLQTA